MQRTPSNFSAFTIISLLCLALSAQGALAEELKVYISADMEGVAGAVTSAQLDSDGFEYEQFRHFMTAEVKAAIEAAREAGATEILVSDSHGNGQNLLLDELPQDIQLVRSWPRPLSMMEGIDESFDAAIFIGYHAGAANPSGIRAHTQSGATFTKFRINDIDMSEGSINALIAGHFGVPVVMVSGDDAAVAEVSRLVGPIEGAVVKWSTSNSAGRTLMPEAARALIREKVLAGLARRSDIEPYTLPGPLRLDLSFRNRESAATLAFLPNVTLIDAHTTRFIGSILEISRFTEFVLEYPETMQD